MELVAGIFVATAMGIYAAYRARSAGDQPLGRWAGSVLIVLGVTIGLVGLVLAALALALGSCPCSSCSVWPRTTAGWLLTLSLPAIGTGAVVVGRTLRRRAPRPARNEMPDEQSGGVGPAAAGGSTITPVVEGRRRTSACRRLLVAGACLVPFLAIVVGLYVIGDPPSAHERAVAAFEGTRLPLGTEVLEQVERPRGYLWRVSIPADFDAGRPAYDSLALFVEGYGRAPEAERETTVDWQYFSDQRYEVEGGCTGLIYPEPDSTERRQGRVANVVIDC